jgi:signal peptidase I
LEVSATSMESTLFDGERVVVDNCVWLPLRLGSGECSCLPARGQIVVFRSSVNHSLLVKRVIAIGGDSVRVKQGRVFVNGTALAEPYVHHLETYKAGDDFWPRGDSNAIREIVLPQKSYFVMGDNRDISLDSRVLGPISSEMIVGVVKARIPPVAN